MTNRILIFFYIMNINIYNLFYICTLACIWALFLRINLFVFVFVLNVQCRPKRIHRSPALDILKSNLHVSQP